MKVFLYGMKKRARDLNNYFRQGYIRDLYLEEMTCDLRDEFFNVLVYDRELPVEIINLYDYEFIAKRSMDISKESL